ncbi:MAG: hypothetical protein JO316_22760 [Abitibacteriaceae bacterium]|nr:hypothetical protein [Abditibacteriaceae bacterium]
MSISTYQNEVARLNRDIGDLRRQIGQESQQLGRINNEISSILRSLNSSSQSFSSASSKLSQLSSKQHEAARIETKVGDLERRIGDKQRDLARASQSLQSAQEQELRRQNDDAKKRHDNELRNRREITREMERQTAIQSHLRHTERMANLRHLPSKIKVLFCAADPQDSQYKLSLDEEARSIAARIRASEHRDSVELESIWAVRSVDLLDAMNEHKPHIVHFSGHGSDTDEIIFLDTAGNAKAVSKTAIVAMLASTAENLRVVVFNTCFSKNQAEEMTKHIDAAIGMAASIEDEAARNFSAQFYSAIGFGHSIKSAYDQAKAFLMAENVYEADTPILFTREGIDPTQIILVKP